VKKPITTCNNILPFTPTGAFAWANFSAGRCGGFFFIMENLKSRLKQQVLFALSNLGALASMIDDLKSETNRDDVCREIRELARQSKFSLTKIEEAAK
jgi:hypothetical protein